MVVRQSHLIAAVLLVAIFASYFAQKAQNDHALSVQRDANILTCEKSVERSSYIANGFRILSTRVGGRGNPGDTESAQNYLAVGQSIVSTFPRVAQRDSRVDRIEESNGRIVFRIPDEVRALEKKGCEQAYGRLPAGQ